MKKSLATTIVAGALALSMAFATAAFADPAGTVDPPSTDYTGWVNANGNKYWFDSGVMARSKEIFDPGSDAWYWLDADGTMAHDKDVYQHSNGGKWVRYDRVTGKMVKGLHHQDGSYYYFDQTTGAMAHSRVWVPEWNAYATFDSVTGRLVNNNSNSGNTGGTGRNIRGQWCKSREQGTQKLDGDGTPIVCECRNGNKRPHWYAR